MWYWVVFGEVRYGILYLAETGVSAYVLLELDLMTGVVGWGL